MFKIAFLPVTVIAVAAVGVSSYTTLAGPGPITFAPAARDFPDAALGVSHSPRGQEGQEGGDGEVGRGADRKASAIADEFGVTKDEVLAHHNSGVGWGALFKLYKLARAQGISLDELLAGIPVNENGEREYHFGELRKALSDEQRALYESGPKNLGQLVSAAGKKARKVSEEGGSQSLSEDGSRGNGKVPPGQAKKRR